MEKGAALTREKQKLEDEVLHLEHLNSEITETLHKILRTKSDLNISDN